MKLYLTIVGLAISIALISGTILASSMVDSLTIGAFTIDATGSGNITVKPPTRPGTLAITADLSSAPPVNIIAGQATLNGGVVTVTFPAQPSPPICVAIDVTAASAVRRGPVTVTQVTFEGVSNHAIEYICTTKNN